MLLLTAAVPAAWLVLPRVHQRMMLAKATSDDPAERAIGLSYITRHAEEPRVLAGALRLLDPDKPDQFDHVRFALDLAGVWSRQTVGEQAFLDWLMLRAELGDNETRSGVPGELAAMHEHAASEQVVDILRGLAKDESPDVRLNALVAIAELGGDVHLNPQGSASRAAAADAYRALAASLTGDADSIVARHAWIIATLLGAKLTYAPPQDLPLPAAEALIWSMGESPDRQHDVQLAMWLLDSGQSEAMRATAAYALREPSSPAAVAALLAACAAGPEAISESDDVVILRSLLALPRPDVERRPFTPLEEVVSSYAVEPGRMPQPELVTPLMLASVYRLGIAGEAKLRPGDELSLLTKLATVEGQPDRSMHWPVAGDPPAPLRIATVAVAKSPMLDDLMPALDHPDPVIRDEACIVAATTFDDAQLKLLVDRLLRSLSDDANASGAILSGLTGHGSDLLGKRVEFERDWTMLQLLRIGLWMQEKEPGLDARQVENLLLHESIPRTTVALALMHRHNPAGIDLILAPRGEPAEDVLDLLRTQRWWRVLDHYLPDSAPPLWLWADDQLLELQLDILRDWCLVHRSN